LVWDADVQATAHRLLVRHAVLSAHGGDAPIGKGRVVQSQQHQERDGEDVLEGGGLHDSGMEWRGRARGEGVCQQVPKDSTTPPSPAVTGSPIEG